MDTDADGALELVVASSAMSFWIPTELCDDLIIAGAAFATVLTQRVRFSGPWGFLFSIFM